MGWDIFSRGDYLWEVPSGGCSAPGYGGRVYCLHFGESCWSHAYLWQLLSNTEGQDISSKTEESQILQQLLSQLCSKHLIRQALKCTPGSWTPSRAPGPKSCSIHTLFQLPSFGTVSWCCTELIASTKRDKYLGSGEGWMVCVRKNWRCVPGVGQTHAKWQLFPWKLL